RGLQHHAFRELVDNAALDFLPGRLVIRKAVAGAIERGAASGQFLVRYQYVRRALAQVDPYPVARPEQCQATAGGRLRRGVEDGRRAGCAGLTAIAYAG